VHCASWIRDIHKLTVSMEAYREANITVVKVLWPSCRYEHVLVCLRACMRTRDIGVLVHESILM